MTFGEWAFLIMFWSAMCALFVIHVGKHIHTPGMLWLWQKLWYTDHVRVQLLSYNNKIYHCLVKPCADGSCEGYLYLGSNQGKLKLCASGIVDPECECAFLYVWRHMDHDLRVAQRLAFCEIPTWDAWHHMEHLEKLTTRNRIAHDMQP